MVTPEPRQLTLGVSHRDDTSFDNFYASEESGNAQLLSEVRRQLEPFGEQLIYLWGSEGAGASHLLQAACHAVNERGGRAQYLPLATLADRDPEALLDNLEAAELVCLDDLHAVSELNHWQQPLFHFFNRMRDSGRRLLIAARLSPRQLSVSLPDLQSRLTWGLTFQLSPLNDDEKLKALQLRASLRGLELSDDVGVFILSRVSRRASQLFELLEQLDQQSLTEQRRLTIPFVKQVLDL